MPRNYYATTLEHANLPCTRSQANVAKHIDIRYWKTREYQEQRRLTVRHIDGDKNPAGMFTKAIPKEALQQYLHIIGMTGKHRKPRS